MNIDRLRPFKRALQIISCSASLIAAARAELPGFPTLESQAFSRAFQVVSGSENRVLHQISALLISKTNSVMVQEIWVDLATKEYKRTTRLIPVAAGDIDPLMNFGRLLAAKPQHGIWKTSYGPMAYKPDNDEWVPVLLNAETPLTAVLKRMKKEWYLWAGPERVDGCCGDANPADDKRAERALAIYQHRLARVTAGKDETSIRETSGMIDEIRISSAKGTLMARVTNEYLSGSPVSLDLETGEALRKRTNVAIRKPIEPLKFPNQGKGFGLAIRGTSDGPVIHAVQENSPAFQAGVAVGDQIIAVQGKAVGKGNNEANSIMQEIDTADLLLRRQNGTEYRVRLTKHNWINIGPKPR
jgi:hypothetical protein